MARRNPGHSSLSPPPGARLYSPREGPRSPLCKAREVTQTSDETGLRESTGLLESTELNSPWVTIVWNDPVNLMSYVSWVFRSYFGFSREEADRLMLQVHHDGRSVVATGSREEMERHVEAMHDYGLWATLQKADA